MPADPSTTRSIMSRMIGTLSNPIRIPNPFGGRSVDTRPVDAALARLSQVPGMAGPVMPALTLDEAVREAYSMSHFVHGCVAKIATAVSSVPWGLERRDPKSRQWIPVPDSDYEELLENPNPYMAGQDLFERWAMHLILSGNCLGIKVRPISGKGKGGAPKELFPVNPDYLRPIKDKQNFLSHYELRVDGGAVPINPADVIHIQISDPRDPFWGMSPLQALGRVIATEVDALTWWRQSIRNRASKLGVMSFPHELTPEQFDQVQQALIAQATGPWNAGLPFIIGQDAKWTSGSSTPAEMDFVKLRQMTREEIMGVLGVSPIIMGIQEYSSYNNIVTARLMLWLDTVVPILNNLRAAMDRALLPDFIAPAQLRQYQTGFDLTNVDALTANMVNIIAVATALFGMGVPFSQINARLKLGFSEFKGWDTSWLPSGLVPSDQLAENAAAGGASAGAGGAAGAPHPVTEAAAGRAAEKETSDHDEGPAKLPPLGKSYNPARRYSRSAVDARDAIAQLRTLIPDPSKLTNGHASARG